MATSLIAPTPDQIQQTMAQPAQNGDQPQQPAAQPGQKPGLFRSLIVGALSGLAGAAGSTSFGGGLASGAAGDLRQQQQQVTNQLAQDQNTRANADQQSRNAESQARLAQMQLQNRQMSMQLHALDPHDPQFVQNTVNGLAASADKMIEAGGLIKTPQFDSAQEADKYIHDNHLDKGDFQVLLRPIHNEKGGISYVGLQMSDAPSTKDTPVTYQGEDGKMVTATIPAGTPLSKIAQLTTAATQQQVNAQFKQKDQELKDQTGQAQTAGQLLYEGKLAPSQIPTKGGQRIQAVQFADQMAKQNGKAEGYNAEAADADFKNKSNFMVGSDTAGRQVVGTPDELKAAGVTATSKLDTGDVGKVVVARQLTSPGGLFDLVDKDLAQFKPEELSALNSRWNEFLAGKIGQGDERFAALRTHTHLLSTAMMQAHVGSSGGEGMMEHFANLADAGKMDGTTLKAALAAEKQYVTEKAARPQAAATTTASKKDSLGIR